jgi:hypothetical protein
MLLSATVLRPHAWGCMAEIAYSECLSYLTREIVSSSEKDDCSRRCIHMRPTFGNLYVFLPLAFFFVGTLKFLGSLFDAAEFGW